MAIADYGLHVCCDLHLFFSFQMNALLRTVLYRKVMLKRACQATSGGIGFCRTARILIRERRRHRRHRGGGRTRGRTRDRNPSGGSDTPFLLAILRFFSRSSVSFSRCFFTAAWPSFTSDFAPAAWLSSAQASALHCRIVAGDLLPVMDLVAGGGVRGVQAELRQRRGTMRPSGPCCQIWFPQQANSTCISDRCSCVPLALPAPVACRQAPKQERG